MIIAISILAVFAFAFYFGRVYEWRSLRRKRNKLPYYQRCMRNVILLGPGFEGIAAEYDRERLRLCAIRAACLGAHRPELDALDLMLDCLVRDTQLGITPMRIDDYLANTKSVTDLAEQTPVDESGKIG